MGSDLALDNTLFALKRSSIVACVTELLNSQNQKQYLAWSVQLPSKADQ